MSLSFSGVNLKGIEGLFSGVSRCFVEAAVSYLCLVSKTRLSLRTTERLSLRWLAVTAKERRHCWLSGLNRFGRARYLREHNLAAMVGDLSEIGR